MQHGSPAPYAAFAKKSMDDFGGQDVFTKESDVAETVWQAVHDTTGRPRFPAVPTRSGSTRRSDRSAGTVFIPGRPRSPGR
ncbi:hypothetical protein [Streptomyces sp. NPDC059455]|uniref:hypothetical protein n=1 Tax=Streptomyces sp. NPDC059455 TaxID=3346837 RepID=UPI00367B552A